MMESVSAIGRERIGCPGNRPMRRHTVSLAMAVVLIASTRAVPLPAAAPVDQLTDLTGGAVAVVTLKARDNFANEFLYDVTVKNLSPDPLVADSLVVVVDQITDLAAKDATDRIEVVGYDGQTPAGKPYFRIPPGPEADLPPHGESRPVAVRLRNPYYTILFTPSFRVLGQRRPPAAETLQSLIQAMLKNGLVTLEDLLGLSQSGSAAPTPSQP